MVVDYINFIINLHLLEMKIKIYFKELGDGVNTRTEKHFSKYVKELF